MGLEIVILSEVSQIEKEKYHVTSLTCGNSKEVIQMHLFTKGKQTQGPHLWFPGEKNGMKG